MHFLSINTRGRKLAKSHYCAQRVLLHPQRRTSSAASRTKYHTTATTHRLQSCSKQVQVQSQNGYPYQHTTTSTFTSLHLNSPPLDWPHLSRTPSSLGSLFVDDSDPPTNLSQDPKPGPPDYFGRTTYTEHGGELEWITTGGPKLLAELFSKACTASTVLLNTLRLTTVSIRTAGHLLWNILLIEVHLCRFLCRRHG